MAAISPVELHVRVTADDRACPYAGEQRRYALLVRPFEENVDVVPRRRVTEEHAAEAVHLQFLALGHPVEEVDLLGRELLSRPVERVRRRESLLTGLELAVGIAA